jgi:hypothetical protein
VERPIVHVAVAVNDAIIEVGIVVLLKTIVGFGIGGECEYFYQIGSAGLIHETHLVELGFFSIGNFADSFTFVFR